MSSTGLNEFFHTIFLKHSHIQESLSENFSLCHHGNVVFHWTDFHETCHAVKMALLNNTELTEEFKAKEVALQGLSQIPLWIRSAHRVYETTVFHLYEDYIVNKGQLLIDVNSKTKIDLSFISSTGPFRQMTISECFNKSTYKDFVMVNLINGKISKRDYRIRLKAKVLMESGTDFGQSTLIELEQLTLNGMLFSVDSDYYIKNVSKATSLRILLDSSALEQACGKNLLDLKDHLSQFTYNLLYSSRQEDAIHCQIENISINSSFDFNQNRKIYLFMPYSKLTAHTEKKVQSIQNFVGHTRDLIREYYKRNLLTDVA